MSLFRSPAKEAPVAATPTRPAQPVSPPSPRAVSSESEPNEYERAAAGEKVVFPMPQSEQPHPVHGFGPIPEDTQE